MLQFRLTYAMHDETIYVVELETSGDDILAAYDTAQEYLINEHGYKETLKIKAISILLIEKSIYEN